MIRKCCTRCNLYLPFTSFSKQKGGRYGITSRCKTCCYAIGLERLERDPDRVRELNAEKSKKWRDRHRSSRHKEWSIRQRKITLNQYGLTQEAYDALLAGQQNNCVICGTDDPQHWSQKFQVDHCHKTGMVRGLLCSKCNGGLGLLGDSSERLQKAADYLRDAEERSKNYQKPPKRPRGRVRVA